MDILEIEKIIRNSLSEEQDATAKYLERIKLLQESGDDSDEIKKLIATFKDVADEEKVHVGEFREMLKVFDISDDKEDEGEDEVENRDKQIDSDEDQIDWVEEFLHEDENNNIDNNIDDINIEQDVDSDKPLDDLETNKISVNGVYQTLALNMNIDLGLIQLRPLTSEEFGVFDEEGKLIDVADLTTDGVKDILVDNNIIKSDDIDFIKSDDTDLEEDYKEKTLDQKMLKDYLSKEHTKALQNIKNMSADDIDSFYKGYATAIHEIQRKFLLQNNQKNESLDSVKFDDYNKFKIINNYHAIDPEKEKGCCECKFACVSGTAPICTYLGKSMFPDREVRCDRVCDKFKKGDN